MSSTRTDLDLYSVDGSCRAQYLGSLRLDGPAIDLGLPLGNQVLLAFVFSRSTALGSSDSSVAIEKLIMPRKGYRYEFEVAYLKSSYSATALEFGPGRSTGQEMEHRRLKGCIAK